MSVPYEARDVINNFKDFKGHSRRGCNNSFPLSDHHVRSIYFYTCLQYFVLEWAFFSSQGNVEFMFTFLNSGKTKYEEKRTFTNFAFVFLKKSGPLRRRKMDGRDSLSVRNEAISPYANE